jgi:hypothetical protein
MMNVISRRGYDPNMLLEVVMDLELNDASSRSSELSPLAALLYSSTDI